MSDELLKVSEELSDLNDEECAALAEALADERNGKGRWGKRVVDVPEDVAGRLRYRSPFLYFAWFIALLCPALAVIDYLTSSTETPNEIYLSLLGLAVLLFLRAKAGGQTLDFDSGQTSLKSFFGGSFELGSFNYARAYRSSHSTLQLLTVIVFYRRDGVHLLPKLLACLAPRAGHRRAVLFMNGWKNEQREIVSANAVGRAIQGVLRNEGFKIKKHKTGVLGTLSWEAERS